MGGMTSRPEPRTLEVLNAETLSPSMHRLSLGGAGLAGFPQGQAGGYIKLMLPDEGERPIVRTYTIRRQTPEALIVDFALHGGEAAGPATRFALRPAPRFPPPLTDSGSWLSRSWSPESWV